MNTYTYDQIKIGQTESFSVRITQTELDSFCELTGDLNPLHCDEDFAKHKGYDSCIVYGLPSASYLSTLVGMYLPGERSLIQEVDLKFPKALVCNKGADITISGTVIEKFDAVKVILLKVAITDEEEFKIVRGNMKVGVLDD